MTSSKYGDTRIDCQHCLKLDIDARMKCGTCKKVFCLDCWDRELVKAFFKYGLACLNTPVLVKCLGCDDHDSRNKIVWYENGRPPMK